MGRANGARNAADYFGAAQKSGGPASQDHGQRGAVGVGGGRLKRFLARFARAPAARPPSDGPASARAGSSFMLMWRSTRGPADILTDDPTGRFGSTTAGRSGSVSRFNSITGLLVDRQWEASATDVVAAARLAAAQQYDDEDDGRNRGSRHGALQQQQQQLQQLQQEWQDEEEVSQRDKTEGPEPEPDAGEWARRQKAVERWRNALRLQQLQDVQDAASEHKPERLEYRGAPARTSRPQPPLLPRPSQPPRPAQEQTSVRASLDYMPSQRRGANLPLPAPKSLLPQQSQRQPQQQQQQQQLGVVMLGRRGSLDAQLRLASDPNRPFVAPTAPAPVGFLSHGGGAGSGQATEMAMAGKGGSAVHERMRETELDVPTVDEEDATLEDLEAEVLGGLSPTAPKTAQRVTPLPLPSSLQAGSGGGEETTGGNGPHVRWSVPTPPATAGAAPPPPRRERSLHRSGASGVSAASVATATTAFSVHSLASGHSAASAATSVLTANAVSVSCRSSASGVLPDAPSPSTGRRTAAPRDRDRDGHTPGAAADMRVAVLRQRTSACGAGPAPGAPEGMRKWPSSNSQGSNASNATAASSSGGNGSNASNVSNGSSSRWYTTAASGGLQATSSYDEEEAAGLARSRTFTMPAAENSGAFPPVERVSNQGGLALRVRHDMENRVAREAVAVASAQRDGGAGAGAGGGSPSVSHSGPLPVVASGPGSASTPRWKDMLAVASAALDDGAQEAAATAAAIAAGDNIGFGGERTSRPRMGIAWQSRSSKAVLRTEPATNDAPRSPAQVPPLRPALSLQRAPTVPLSGSGPACGAPGPLDQIGGASAERLPITPVAPLQRGSAAAPLSPRLGESGAGSAAAAAAAMPPPSTSRLLFADRMRERFGSVVVGANVGSIGSAEGSSSPLPVLTPGPPPQVPAARRSVTGESSAAPTPVSLRRDFSSFRNAAPAEPPQAAATTRAARVTYAGPRPSEPRSPRVRESAPEMSLEDLVLSSLLASPGPAASGAGGVRYSERGEGSAPLTPVPPARMSGGGAPHRPIAARSRRFGGEQLVLGPETSDTAGGALSSPVAPTQPPTMRYASMRDMAMSGT